jgi:hypothetical protein
MQAGLGVASSSRNAVHAIGARVFVALAIGVAVGGMHAAQAAPVIRQGSGANVAGIQAAVDAFRVDLGGNNNGVGNSYPDGRRELNWDGVPNASAAPNFLAPDFFNTTSPRGIVFHTLLEDSGSAFNDFIVSASAASGTPVRFGNINPNYSSTFITFSSERLFTPRAGHALLVKFYQPGTTTPAVVKGFGAVFSDVDSTSASYISYYAADGSQLVAVAAPAFNGGLSFVGVSFDAGEMIDHVVIRTGTHALSASNNDGVSGVDVVALDDFIYGEPRPASGCLFTDGFDCQVP